ncbi:hypothetical protein P171DRAFT_504185 [Karstenula rhodostoma CBS 690.94]|uniref:Uncharacterized protein n=1 Tax=Karstenula rhodostoma CBS 690.94 TaxID=1392251 RepID=A0A9P4U754_9PLEO|nr:hypothetical protein P171DRAFT_504185 [Karstenula rhodostoma CBS 690.94]
MSGYNHNNFNGLNPFNDAAGTPSYFDTPSMDFNDFHPAAGGSNTRPPSFYDNGTAGQYRDRESKQLSPLQDNLDLYQDDSLQSPVHAGPSNSSSSARAVLNSAGNAPSTEPTSPTSPTQELSARARRVYDRLPESIRHTVGWHPQLDRMLSEHPHFIPTFDFESAMSMTSRDVVNPVSGDIPPAVVDDDELAAIRNHFGLDLNTLTVEQLAGMGHDFLDMIAAHPKIIDLLQQYRYEPTVAPETISTILPNVGIALNKNPCLLEYYQVPLRKGEDNGEEEEEEDGEMADDEEEENEDQGSDGKGKGKKSERKFLPRKVQYAPYRYMFKSAAEARAHRTKVRHPAKIAKDIDRVEQYGRYYWTRRIYESMINVDLIFDNKTSVIATNFSKLHHFNEEDLEATAHHIFDECISVHRRGWTGYDYNRHDYKRGKLKDIFPGTIEGRLERICGILKHSKAIANDCLVGGNDLLMQTVDNPIHRASTKTANNKGNMERALRLRKQETDRQREKRLAREAAKKERDEARKLEKERKEAEKQKEKERKEKERQEAKEKKEAEKQQEKERKQAEREREKERKQAEREQAAAARRRR